MGYQPQRKEKINVSEPGMLSTDRPRIYKDNTFNSVWGSSS